MRALLHKAFDTGKNILFIGPFFDAKWGRSLVRRLKGKAVCLCYHRVGDTAQQSFLTEGGSPVMDARQLKADILFRKKLGFSFITFEDLRANSTLDPDRPYVILSFDDCFKSNYTIGAAVLAECGVKAVFFQISSIVNSDELLWENEIFWYCRDETGRRRFTELARRVLSDDPQIVCRNGWELAHQPIEFTAYGAVRKLLDAAEESLGGTKTMCELAVSLHPRDQDIIQAVRAGHEIASHGDRHYTRVNVSQELFQKDLETSIQKIKAWTGQAPLTYAYPHGQCIEGDRDICANYFKHVLTVRRGVIDSFSDPLDLPRYYWPGPPKNSMRRKRWLFTGLS